MIKKFAYILTSAVFPDFDTKASDAVDFSDITEMADEEEEKNRIQAAMSSMPPLQRSRIRYLLSAVAQLVER